MNPGLARLSPFMGLYGRGPRELDAKESNLEAIALYLLTYVFLERNFVIPSEQENCHNEQKSRSLKAISVLEMLKVRGNIAVEEGLSLSLAAEVDTKTQWFKPSAVVYVSDDDSFQSQ